MRRGTSNLTMVALFATAMFWPRTSAAPTSVSQEPPVGAAGEPPPPASVGDASTGRAMQLVAAHFGSRLPTASLTSLIATVPDPQECRLDNDLESAFSRLNRLGAVFGQDAIPIRE